MTRLRVVRDDDRLPEVQCLLCGGEAATWADLCDPCADTVSVIAARVVGRVLVEIGTPPIPGQLTLDET